VLRNVHDVPTVGTLHSLLPDRPGLVRAGLRVTGIPADRIVFTAVSEAAASRLRPALRPGQPVQVLHNGIDPSAWRIAHRPTGGFDILAVGRLAPRKRPLVLVDALAALAARAPDLAWSATLVGDGPQRGQVVQAIRAAGLHERVRLTGALSRAEIRELLGRADAFVAPSTLESFGIAALEARCAGVPIVGMAGSGVTEFVAHGVDGLLATSDADLSSCLERLSTEAGLVAAIRAHNAVVPVPMAWDDVLESHADLYRYATAVPAHRASASVRSRRRLAPAGGPGSLRRRA
jgi:glycosyltransferase involved in cell wall biosynthesis